jgi:hypothetical protein
MEKLPLSRPLLTCCLSGKINSKQLKKCKHDYILCFKEILFFSNDYLNKIITETSVRNLL